MRWFSFRRQQRQQVLDDEEDFLLVTWDSCRYDAYLEAHTPRLDDFGKARRAWAMGTYTLPSHLAMFYGFLPHVFASEPLYNRHRQQLWRISHRNVHATPLGTAGPIALVDDLSDPFLVMNGDILTSLDYRHIVEFHRRAGSVATIACCQKEVSINLGVLETNDEDRLLDYIEKPVLTYCVSMGAYVFSRRVLDYVREGERVDLPDLVKRLLRNEQAVSLYKFDGHWKDIGTTEDYE